MSFNDFSPKVAFMSDTQVFSGILQNLLSTMNCFLTF